MGRQDGIFDYARLDISGEGDLAATRMEARAREPASEALFDTLIRPLLPGVGRVLEVGCGTGALARRIAQATNAEVFATDKSSAMLDMARKLASNAPRPCFEPWDVTQPAPVSGTFDLIVSSVMVPYLSEAQVEALIKHLGSMLAPNGTLAFIEQDLMTDSVWFPDYTLLAKVFARDERPVKRTQWLGLRPVLRAAGLELLPRASFLWTDEGYGLYLRDLLQRLADDALKAGRIDGAQREHWLTTLDELARRGDFYYGLQYHRVAARRVGTT